MSSMSESLEEYAWRKSSRSVANGACVEAAACKGAALIRDSADRTGTVLRYSAAAWRTFIVRIASGRGV
jgi:hypothetical protein